MKVPTNNGSVEDEFVVIPTIVSDAKLVPVPTKSPTLTDAGPSGLRNPPRPFVLHASHLNCVTVESGDAFTVDVAVFYVEVQAVDLE